MSPDQKTYFRWVGKNTIRSGGAKKVMCKANFGADIQLLNMLKGIDARHQQAAG
jgi:hypothetical protein